MSKTVKKLSPFALGLALCCHQAIQLPTAYAASLNPSSPPSDGALSSNNGPRTLATDSTGKSATTDSTKTSVTANIDCPLNSNISQSTSSSTTKTNSGMTEASGVTPLPVSPDNSLLKYESDEKVASSDIKDASVTQTPQIAASAESSSSEPVLMAQASLDDCCGIGGTTTCEVGGLPTGGAAVGGLSPLLGLLGLLPAAAIPFAFGGGSDNNNNPAQVPEPSTTPGIVAGFGLMGLYFSRRYLNGKNRQNTFLK